MTQGQIIQVRQRDGVDHWIYARVLNPAINLVEIAHPGNRDHGRQLAVSSADVRTKAEVQALLATAQSLCTGARLSNAQLNTLCAADSFFAAFKAETHAVPRETLQKYVVQHYEAQIKKLT